MNDHPADDFDDFMADLRAWASSTQRFARKLHALSLLQRSRATELRIEAQETVHQVRFRRRSEGDARELVQTLRQPSLGSVSQPTCGSRRTDPDAGERAGPLDNPSKPEGCPGGRPGQLGRGRR